MKRRMIPMLFVCCFVLVNTVCAQEADKPKSPGFDSYDFSQFISSAGQSPHQITKLDNNGEILLACVKGKTRNQLKDFGIRFSESQIELLKTWRLLEEKEATLKTAFPVLDAEMSRRLREVSQAVVPALSRQLEPDILRLTAFLDHNGRKKNAYTILFSYILDDLVWEEFRERDLLGRRDITADTPHWAGEVWAVYPPRPFRWERIQSPIRGSLSR